MNGTASDESDGHGHRTAPHGGQVRAAVHRARERLPIPGKALAGLVVTYLILRVAAVLPLHRALIYYDSGEYRRFPGGPHYRYVDLLGHAIRPWAVPLFYVLFPSDGWRVVAQLVVSIVSWLILAYVVAGSLRTRLLQVAGFVLVLLSSSAVSVTNWDLIILSESLSLSLAALTLAAWLRWVRHRTPLGASGVACATGLLMFTRPTVVPLVGVLAVSVAVSAIRARARALKLITAAVLLITMGWGLFVMNNVEHAAAARPEGVGYVSQNFLLVLRARILTDPETLRWFRRHGMPAASGIGPPNPRDGGFAHVLAVFSANTALRHWAEEQSSAALVRFSLEHPDKFPYHFGQELPQLLTPRVEDVVYAPMPSVLPPPIESMLTPTDQRSTLGAGSGTPVALVGILALFVGSVFLPRKRPPMWSGIFVAIGAVSLSVGGLYLAWLGSPVEIPRHAVPFTVIIPLMLMFGTLLFVDAAVAPPARASTPPAA